MQTYGPTLHLPETLNFSLFKKKIFLKTKSPVYFLTFKNNPDLKLIFLKYFQLPSDFGSLSKLKILGLTGNQFSSFPKEILSLASLEKLYIGQDEGAKLTHLPECIKRLQVSLPKWAGKEVYAHWFLGWYEKTWLYSHRLHVESSILDF